ncbi:MAG: matrixin family metalloprotease [Acidobacteriota bacterium]
MTTLRLVAFVCLSLAASSPVDQPAATATIRVRVCVFNDSQAPVAADRIAALLAPVPSEIMGRTGVLLTYRPVRSYHGAVNPLKPELQIASFNRECAQDCEMKVLFTNRSRLTNAGVRLSGESHPLHGYVILYDSDAGFEARDLGGNLQVLTTLRHEIGHLLGADHTTDRSSFMFAEPNLSRGRWTEAVAQQIRSHRQSLLDSVFLWQISRAAESW